MEYLMERTAYLRGLADGLSIDESSKEGKVLLHIIETLDEFADAIVTLHDEQEELEEYVEALNEDLEDVEDELFEFDNQDIDDDDINFIKIKCPNCDEEIYVDENLFFQEKKEITCPRCDIVIDLNEYEESCCQHNHCE